MRTGARIVLGLVTALLVLAALPPSTTPAAAAVTPSIRIVDQTDSVEPDGSFHAFLDVLDAPAGAELAVDVYDRITDLDQLADALDGRPRDAQVTYPVIPLAERSQARQSSGFSIDLHDGRLSRPKPGVWSRDLREPGVYPIRVRLRDADGGELTHIVTFLHRSSLEPTRDTRIESTVVLDLTPPRTTATEPAPDPVAIRHVLEVLDRHPDVPLGVHLNPDTAAPLLDDPVIGPLVEDLVRRDTVDLLTPTLVPVDPQELAEEGLADAIDTQVRLGREEIARRFDKPGAAIGILRTPVDDDTAARLGSAGMSELIVTDAVVDTASVSGPMRLGAGGSAPTAVTSSLVALPTDPADDPRLTVTHLLTDALVRTDLTGRLATTAVLVDASVDPTVLDRFLEQIGSDGSAITATRPSLLLNGAPPPAVALRPTTAAKSIAYVRERADTVSLHRSRRSMLDPDASAELDDDFEIDLARTESIDLTEHERLDLIGDLRTALHRTLDAVHTSEAERITLGTRDAHIPIAFTSDATEPLSVRIHLSASDRLDFPRNEIETVIQPGQRTVVQVPVRSLTSGDTPMTVRVTTPDGRFLIATARYTVRSTAVSSVGLVLTIGAAGFLVVWWSRHIIRSRREHRSPRGRSAKM